MSDSQNEFAAAIRSLRQELRLTQAELATELGITPSSIYRYETGARPDTQAVLLLASYAQSHSGNPELIQIFSKELGSRADSKALTAAFKTLANARNKLTETLLPAKEERARDPLWNEALQALGGLKHEDLRMALAFINLLQESTDETTHKVLAVLVRPWLIRVNRRFPTQPAEESSN